jgi:hypothetical protein
VSLVNRIKTIVKGEFRDANEIDMIMDLLDDEMLNKGKNEKLSFNEDQGNDILNLIEKLAEFKDRGILTNEEFNNKKTELLKIL